MGTDTTAPLRTGTAADRNAEIRTSEVLRLAQPRWRAFAPGLAFGLLSAMAAVTLLAASAWLITRAAEHPPILFLSAAIVGVRAAALGRATFRYLERLASHDAAFRGLADLRVGIYERLVPLTPDGLKHTRRGDLLSRLVGDVDELQNLPLRVLQPLLTAVLVCLAAVVGVWILLPAAGLALAVTLLLAFVLATAANSRTAAQADRELSPVRADFADQTLDFVGALDVLTAYSAVDDRLASLQQAERRLTSVAVSKARGSAATAAVVSLLGGAATFLALAYGVPALGAGTANGLIDAPTLAMLALVPIAVFEVFGVVPLAVGACRQVSVSAARVATAVPAVVPVEIPVETLVATSLGLRAGEAPIRPAVMPGVAPTIELSGLSARWPGGTADAFAGVSLVIRPGDRVQVTGRSGSGKTSLAHVLVRFLDFEAGTFTIDGVDARRLPPERLRSLVGLCEQHPHLFDASLRQNLLFAREEATDDELLRVLDRVGLSIWVDERGGLGAQLGERGALVSGGQAQRLALARVLLADFPVVVFDEPTANVDAELADALITDLLRASGPSRSVVLISHADIAPALVGTQLRMPDPS
ncbi:thiol reductant ABC exporter subunit CydC [Subtercola frigoramans]|uniref:ATP-binding cassette subfamily C protein CydC n=1 Tax=Subtercola frigoramans TaxID=120298 RepID=A0ABS2L6E4_9MICO|nr:thiol reductant ABC exporter subunit CydC [Subtercola frigoramans]MBM7472637.1 ATP-binding cassette subfamily C protein CydC [Subtercola frigoramans]